MTLTPLELLRTRAADGLASDTELAELAAAGVDVAEWALPRLLLREALAIDPPDLAGDVLAALGLSEGGLAEGGDLAGALAGLADEAPDLADDVLAALGLTEGADVRRALADALGDDQGPDLSGDVLAALGRGGERSLRLGAAFAAALAEERGEAPELADGVLARLGLREGAPPLAEALAAEAGDIDIADAVMERLGAEDAPAAPNVVAFPGRRVVFFGGLLAAAAAALLVVVTKLPIGAPPVAYQLAEVNQVEIESLESSPDVMVQIFQTEEDAPTIIFIDEDAAQDAIEFDGVPQ